MFKNNCTCAYILLSLNIEYISYNSKVRENDL